MTDFLTPDQTGQPDDETMQALLGLHPHQIAIAQALAAGSQPPPTDVASAPTRAIAAPSGASRAINVPPAEVTPTQPAEGSTEDLEAKAAAPRMPLQSATPPPPDPLAARTSADQAELARVQSTGSGLEQFQRRHPIAGGIARTAAGIGSAFFPGIAAAIPGTDLHHQGIVAGDTSRVAEDLGEAKEQAATADTASQTALRNQQTEDLQHPQPKVGETPEETTVHDLMTGQNGQPRINPQTNKPYSYLEAFQAVNQAKQDVKPDPEVKTDKVTRVINGVPHEILINAKTGDDIKDEGQTKVPGESAGDKRSAQESAQVEREARQNIRKAEGVYHDTEKSIGQLKASIDASKDGNGLLTSFVPTMEVLGINAANGVHRISPVEAQAANMPGGLVERWNAFFDKASTGKLSPELQKEGKQLADIMLKTSHQRYKSTYDDESQIVEGYGGKGFQQRVKPLPEPTTEPETATGKGALSLAEAQDYLTKAGGDKDKARAAAKADGRTF